MSDLAITQNLKETKMKPWNEIEHTPLTHKEPKFDHPHYQEYVKLVDAEFVKDIEKRVVYADTLIEKMVKLLAKTINADTEAMSVWVDCQLYLKERENEQQTSNN